MKSIALKSLLVVISFCSMASACPMCRDSTAVNSGGGAGSPVALFNASVLSILGAFVVVVGILLVKMVGAIRAIDRLGCSRIAACDQAIPW
jgi:hypothetical protein